ncbi:hypothetical protein EPUS_06743 [Endocarpon pusillum Z07020]|uniref:F-box domain-containing protein n=1 Tax=Endocarpon pusillum (strain Z07020 / HMAS-L-300199) TaxID=1263415 RepID=U1GFR9_ENDPU|nr:uncharacterized protein EPUS_06743 [Endocarpon pusillum Z07020]ERF70958.1 hypothetical protein EPUS_06743 [Endocarpon pusillum Z07020]
MSFYEDQFSSTRFIPHPNLNSTSPDSHTSHESKPAKPSFRPPLEIFEEVTSYLDYLSLKSLSSTNHAAQRRLIPKPYLAAAMLALELYDNDETETLKSKALLPCYQCLRVFPAKSGFEEACDTHPDRAGFRGEFACARMCRSCNYKAGGYLSRVPKWKRLRKVRMGVLKRRGWAPAEREEIYKARRERKEAVKLRRAKEMEGRAWIMMGE